MNDPLGLFKDDEKKDPLGLFQDSGRNDPLGLFKDDEEESFLSKANKTLGTFNPARNLLGAGEAAASVLAPLPSQIVGGLGAFGKWASFQGVDKANETLNTVMQSNFGAGTYEPHTEKGKKFAEVTGEVLNKPVEWSGDVGEYLGGNVGRLAGETLAGTAMALVDPVLGMKGAGALVNRAGKFLKAAEIPKVKGIDLEALNAELSNTPVAKAVEAQGELFPHTPEHQGPTRPPDFVPEMDPRAGRRNAAQQMEMQFEHPQTLDITSDGVAIPHDKTAEILPFRDRLEQSVVDKLDEGYKNQFLEAQQGDLFEPHTNSHRDFTDMRVDDGKGGERPLTSKEFDSTIAKLQEEPTTAFPKEIDKAAAYEQYKASLDPVQKGMFDVQSRQNAFNESNKVSAIERVSTALEAQKASIDSLRQDIRAGKANPHDLIPAMSKLKALENRQSIIKGNAKATVERGTPTAAKKGFNARTRKQGGGVYMGEGVPRRMDTEAAWNAKDRNRYEDPSSTDLHTLARDVAKNGVKKPITITVSGDRGYVTDGNNRLAAARLAGMEDIPYQIVHSDVPFTPDQFDKSQSLSQLGIGADELVAKPKTQAAKDANDWLNDFNNGNVPKSQKGALYMGERGTKVLAAIDKRFEKLAVDKMPTPEFLEKNKNAPDVDQNTVQRAMNVFTKGGDYQAIKTNNPLIKRVVDRFKEADNRTRAAVQAVIRDRMEPAARAMNKTEKAEAWAATQMAENAGKPLTREIMERVGFNEKQIKWAELHTEIMDKMYERLVESMKAAGMEPVSKRVAYAAFRASKDFRSLVYEPQLNAKGEKVVKHIISENTKLEFNREVERYKKAFPEDQIGERRYYGGGGKNSLENGFAQMLEFLAKNDGSFKEYVNKVNEQASADAFDFMNMKSHTLGKKGITGMDGNRIGYSKDPKAVQKLAERNAVDGMNAQIRYVEGMLKWSELSEAVKDTKPVLSPDSGLNMPKAREWSKMYIDNALGNSPSKVGTAFDGLSAAMGDALGTGVSMPHAALTGARHVTNALLLGMSPMFLLTNAVQAGKVMPGVTSWLKSQGMSKGFDFNTGYSYLGKGALDMYNEKMGKPLSPVLKDALKYADEHHAYSSDLFESGGSINADAKYYTNKTMQGPASKLERETRKVMYLGMVRMFTENGMKGTEAFSAAQKVTDMAMNNYSKQEAPVIYNSLGVAGRTAYNLMSYKHNELSRMSMFAREIPNSKNFNPLLTELASQVAFAGIKGTILYAEADEFVKYISDKMGKPTSISKMLMDSKLSSTVTNGLFSVAGLDMSNRLGTAIVPGSGIDAVMPGAGKLVDIAKAAGETIGSPNEYNLKKLAVTSTPAGIAGPLERSFFSKENQNGEEMSFNKNKMVPTATRNNTDKFWKTLGGTGINESKQKSDNNENTRIELAYNEKRKGVLTNMKKEFFSNGKIPASLTEKYIKYEGDTSSLDRQLENMAIEQNIPQGQLQVFRNAASNSITAAKNLQRRTK